MKDNKLNKLLDKQKLLKAQIVDHLDILMGSVVKAPSMSGYCLTGKVKGKTVTRYVRKNVVPEAKAMSAKCQKLWKLLRALSEVNWEILKQKAE